MKTGSSTTTSCASGPGLSAVKHQQRCRKTDFTQRRWCYAFGGIGREWCTMSRYHQDQTINSDNDCSDVNKLKRALLKDRLELMISRKVVVFHQENAKPHTSLQTRAKTAAFRLGCSAPPTVFTRLCAIRPPSIHRKLGAKMECFSWSKNPN